MIVDFREFEDGAAITADLCVIGAGAAGIALARSFIGTSVKVCVLEGGAFEYNESTQSLYDGKILGQSYHPLKLCRWRLLGGTTFHWAGSTGLLNPIDFETRPWVPYSGWPLRPGDLEPYYPRAQAICGSGPLPYDQRLWSAIGMPAPALDESKVRARFWQQRWSFRFGEVYRKELQDAANIQIILNANVVNIQTSSYGKTVERLDVRALDGKAAQARAAVYVLACGGIENARLLLLSNGIQPHGLGNENDLVGRFFGEHLKVRCATVLPADPMRFLTTFRKHRLQGEVRTWAGLCVGEETQQRQKILNGAVEVFYDPDSDSGPLSLRTILQSILAGRWPPDLGRHLANVMTDLDDVAVQTYRRVVHGSEPIFRPEKIYLVTQAEQAPNPESRITLTEERDLLGLQRPALTWRLSDIDKRSIRVMATAIGEELGRLNLARVKLEDWLLDGSHAWPDDLVGAYHHIGTTRMSDDPRTGVVDSNCALHGVNNLYVAGSSVFPTAGYMNPTLTIVALALRLSDHLKARLA